MNGKSPSKIWRKNNANFRLIGSKSKKTGKEFFPPMGFESGPLNREFEMIEFEQQAKLVTWSDVKVGPRGFDNISPYIVGILEFSNGERLTVQIVDVEFDSLRKDDILYPTFRRIFADGEDGLIQYGLKWTK